MQPTDSAFPRITGLQGPEDMGIEVKSTEGIALIDYYAVRAMQAFIQVMGVNAATDFSKRSIPLHAYHVARNMVEERKKYIGETEGETV